MFNWGSRLIGHWGKMSIKYVNEAYNYEYTIIEIYNNEICIDEIYHMLMKYIINFISDSWHSHFIVQNLLEPMCPCMDILHWQQSIYKLQVTATSLYKIFQIISFSIYDGNKINPDRVHLHTYLKKIN